MSQAEHATVFDAQILFQVAVAVVKDEIGLVFERCETRLQGFLLGGDARFKALQVGRKLCLLVWIQWLQIGFHPLRDGQRVGGR